MISTGEYNKVEIQITTFKNKKDKKFHRIMCDERRKHNPSRFICSICLNNKHMDENHNNNNEKLKSKACPLCQKDCDVCGGNETTKLVQTSRTDLSQGLNLLNEVLHVFQNKKVDGVARTSSCKDASVATESPTKCLKSQLSMSKIFRFSINHQENCQEHSKFVILNCVQPEFIKSQFSITKHKSSSIPQMKVEELKHSLKEKTKSKDAIEEVNRMFATVKKFDNESLDDTNRPMVRSGPRVLPVVKTKNYQNEAKKESIANHSNSCKCCQTENYYLSCGDSKEFCKKCHNENLNTVPRCEKCVYMLSCHHNRFKCQKNLLICECCKKMNLDYCGNDSEER